jgi:hypothetical protein
VGSTIGVEACALTGRATANAAVTAETAIRDFLRGNMWF